MSPLLPLSAHHPSLLTASTEMTAGGSSEDQKSDLSGTGKGEGNPAGRPGDEKDMAGCVLFLASRAGIL
jgi:NAD(P)-dependent dehydrogenase (short-subunit alcohol dehydrogenase family)